MILSLTKSTDKSTKVKHLNFDQSNAVMTIVTNICAERELERCYILISLNWCKRLDLQHFPARLADGGSYKIMQI